MWQLAALGDAGLADGLLDGPLECLLADVVAAGEAGARVEGGGAGGEDPLPVERPAGAGVLAVEGVGQGDAGQVCGQVVLVEQSDALELAGEWLAEGLGEHGDAVLRPFAVADGDLAHLKVHVLDSEADAVHEAQAGAVEQARHEVVLPVEAGEQRSHLGACEDDGEPLGAPGRFDAVEGGQRGVEDLAEEELECVAGDVLGAGGHVPLDGEVRQVGADLGGPESVGPCPAVEEEEAPDGAEVSVLGVDAEVSESERPADPVEEIVLTLSHGRTLSHGCVPWQAGYNGFTAAGLVSLWRWPWRESVRRHGGFGTDYTASVPGTVAASGAMPRCGHRGR